MYEMETNAAQTTMQEPSHPLNADRSIPLTSDNRKPQKQTPKLLENVSAVAANIKEFLCRVSSDS
jgi:hypothetical protein